MKKMQKARAEALEAALGAVLRGIASSDATSSTIEPDEVLAYAKFVLGGTKKKRRRTKVQGGERRAYVAKQGTPLPRSLDDLTGGGWKPVGEDPGDREVLTQWAEAIRQQDAAREAAREARELEHDPEEKVEADREASFQDDGRPLWGARPEVRTVMLTPASSPVDKRIAEETMGLVPGALDEELTITNEGTFFADGSPAEVALREVEVGKTNDSAGAKNWVLQEGVRVGCPECTVEEKRRRQRDELKKEGRRKLTERLDATTGRMGPLDDDELLAVAGSELYPANDEEPSREVKIRNRKGEVRTHTTDGWTMTPDNPWRLGHAWTSSEMVRRGPWHVV